MRNEWRFSNSGTLVWAIFSSRFDIVRQTTKYARRTASPISAGTMAGRPSQIMVPLVRSALAYLASSWISWLALSAKYTSWPLTARIALRAMPVPPALITAIFSIKSNPFWLAHKMCISFYCQDRMKWRQDWRMQAGNNPAAPQTPRPQMLQPG